MAGPARTWLAECYSPGIDRHAVVQTAERALEAAAGLRRGGHAVRYLGALLVAEDEVVFQAFSADDAGPVHEVGRIAGIRFDRVVEVDTVRAAGGGDVIGQLFAGPGGAPTPP